MGGDDRVDGSGDESSDVTAGTCTHDPCVTGGALSATCEACVATVCAQDSFCCSSSWDSLCVSAARSLCGTRCSATGGSGGSGGTGVPGGKGGSGGTGTGGTGGTSTTTGAENTNAACSDKIDNDGDGFIDCNDFDCSKNAAVTVCGSTGGSGGTGGTAGVENTNALCSDGVDNDGDGFVDCNDFNCSKNTAVTVCGGTAGTGGTGGTAGTGGGGTTLRVRLMASNMTGDSQLYGPEATRVFQALDPDIVAIQEFKAGDNTQAALRGFVDTAFGTNYSFFRESGGGIPNGVISRYPIVESGEWDDSSLTDRDFVYARIALPNGRNLWAVSVHLRTTSSSARLSQATQLVNYIKGQVPTSDLLFIGGDLNTDSRTEACVGKLGELFVTASPYPRDQANNTNTNNSRQKPYDWLLADPDLDPFETPVVVGASSFPQGLVFDSRVFTPLSAVAPVLASDTSTFQHMGVVREFLIPSN